MARSRNRTDKKQLALNESEFPAVPNGAVEEAAIDDRRKSSGLASVIIGQESLPDDDASPATSLSTGSSIEISPFLAAGLTTPLVS